MPYSFLEKTDYTLLDANVSDEEILELCRKAISYKVCSVCVMPNHVSIAKKELAGSDISVCTVISFPEGSNSLSEKIKETQQVCADGADEVDLVMNYHLIDDFNYLRNELTSIKSVCNVEDHTSAKKVGLKIIVESGLLSIDQTKKVTELCIEAKVDFIKSSTGKIQIGAEIEKIKAMRETIIRHKSKLKIKASGGIRTKEQIEKFDPYVDRFGIGFATVDQLVNGEIDLPKSDY